MQVRKDEGKVGVQGKKVLETKSYGGQKKQGAIMT